MTLSGHELVHCTWSLLTRTSTVALLNRAMQRYVLKTQTSRAVKARPFAQLDFLIAAPVQAGTISATCNFFASAPRSLLQTACPSQSTN